MTCHLHLRWNDHSNNVLHDLFQDNHLFAIWFETKSTEVNLTLWCINHKSRWADQLTNSPKPFSLFAFLRNLIHMLGQITQYLDDIYGEWTGIRFIDCDSCLVELVNGCIIGTPFLSYWFCFIYTYFVRTCLVNSFPISLGSLFSKTHHILAGLCWSSLHILTI